MLNFLANPSEPIENGNNFGDDWIIGEPDSQKVYKIITEGFLKTSYMFGSKTKKTQLKANI